MGMTMIAIDNHRWESIESGLFAGWSKCRACLVAHKAPTADILRIAATRLFDDTSSVG